MNHERLLDVIIVGGSYSGLAAAMALGRSMRDVLIVDAAEPCNRFTPHSHNFITHDGRPPGEIAAAARSQALFYPTVQLHAARVTQISQHAHGFAIATSDGALWITQRVVLATGIVDILPPIDGLAACWGKSVLHCPYCHGYEVRAQPTVVLAHDDSGAELALMVSHWASSITILANGPNAMSLTMRNHLQQRGIAIDERPIDRIDHDEGMARAIHFSDGTVLACTVIYAKVPFAQPGGLAEGAGCELNPEGYIATDGVGRTSVSGIYACGDSTSRLRTVANAVASGTAVGMQINRDLLVESDVMPTSPLPKR